VDALLDNLPLVLGSALGVVMLGLGVWQREKVAVVARETVPYLREVRAEVRKVTWVSWPDLKNMTLVILVIIVISGLVIGLMDWVFSKLLIDLLGRLFG
jgi:preprotein translocase SecE subunit